MINYYHILGIPRQASSQEIKAAYRRLAVRYHPDKNPESSYAEDRFKEISHAYQVLKDPAKKAKHDLMLAYEELQAQTGTTRPAPAQEPYRTAYGSRQAQEYARRYRQRPPQSWHYPRQPSGLPRRYNALATAWAFGIVFAFAVLVVGLSSYRAYQEEQQIIEQTELAESIYQKAATFYEQKNYRYALQLLKTIDEQYKIPYNAGRLKHEVLKKVEEEASLLFEKEDYQQAATYYQLLVEHQPEYNPFVYARLVSSYEMIPDYVRAIYTYERVIQAEPLTIEARNRLAAILFDMEKYEQALKYYRQASDIVVQEYVNLYGHAYPLAVNPAKTPESHYQLHCGLGQTYSSLGMHRQAESAFKWAIFLRPEKPEAHYLQGLNYREAGQQGKACEAWKTAARHGFKPAAEQLKSFCG